MRRFSTRWTRRHFLRGASLGSALGGLALTHGGATMVAAAGRRPGAQGAGVYAELGVRPLINAAGTYTALSASIMPPAVVAAMEDAASRHVSIGELQQAVGERIAGLLGAGRRHS